MFPVLRSLCLALLLMGSALVGAEEPRKPNIILIMADDVGWEAFGCYGGEDYSTPNIDRMAREGVRFAHCYSTPICTTSRVKIMTGKYNFRNYTHFGYLSPNEKTFGHLLKQQGYATAIAGKWQLNGLHNKLPGHDDSSRPHRAGFDEYMLWQLTTNRGKQYPKGGERFWNPVLEHNGRFLTKEMNAGKYGPDMFCDFICGFMQQNADRPFFVYYPMVLVHDPFVPTPDTIGDNADLTKANVGPRERATQKKNFVAMVHYMDKIIGRIIQKTEEIGQAENTIILFTADNGTNVRIKSRWKGREVQGGKAGMKDNGTHVPLVAYWKGKTPKGKVLDDLIDFTDFYATFAAAAGIEMGKNDPVDGRSFFPQLNGKPGNPRDWVLCHYQPYWNKPPGQFIRNATYKLYRDGRFFSISNDMDETHDLSKSDNPEWSALRSGFQQLLKEAPPYVEGRLKGNFNGDRSVHPDWPNMFRRQ